MNFQLNYPIEAYKLDISKAIHIKAKLVQRSIFLKSSFVGTIALALIIMGFEVNSLFESTFLGVGFALFFWAVYRLWILKRAKKAFYNRKLNYINTDVRFTFSDNLFTHRDQEEYHEYTWNMFTKYLLTDEFIFLIREHLGTAYSFSRKQFTKEQFDELHAFLASKLPVWKS